MKDEMIYEGKAKKVFKHKQNPHWVIIEFKDSLTAFNALKKGSFENKGQVNRDIASLIFRYMKKNSIPSHWVSDLGKIEMVVEKVEIIPLEVVVRNILAGSTAKKLGIEEGKILKAPLVEFYYKNDALADPFVSDEQILMMNLVNEQEIADLKKKALKVNQVLKEMWAQAGLDLVDFKIEFGKNHKGEILLADEITPDCCRLWDQKTKEKMDKDRFRRDLGQVKETYEAVLQRLKEVVHV